MKHRIYIFTLLALGFVLNTNAQELYNKTSCSGSGSANQGSHTYEANLSAKSYLPGMGDVRYQLSITNYRITSFTYKGVDASSVQGINFPIIISNIQGGVDFTLEYRLNTRKLFYKKRMLGVRQGYGDYGDLSSSEVQELKEVFGIKEKSDFYNLSLSVDGCKISNTYFDELNEIAKLIDKKIETEKQEAREKERQEQATRKAQKQTSSSGETGNGKSNNDETTQASHRGENPITGDNTEISEQEAEKKRIEERKRKEQERIEQELSKIEEQNRKIDQASDEVGVELGKIFTGEFEPQSMMNITQSVLNTGLINSVEGAMGVGLAGGIGAAAVGIIQQAKEDKIRKLNSKAERLKTNLDKHTEAYKNFQNAVDEDDDIALLNSHKQLLDIEGNILSNVDYLIEKGDFYDLEKLRRSVKNPEANEVRGLLK